ncbi:MAG: phosphodiesterase [Gallionellales bacterium RIFCSPLOWO2_12_FULL_59_22]|nr:MAG: phosphodiesterase [Gallionellales bacterium RIFCSPLOWO2_02_FULL_59_110]OGT12088.1 MAG: phosphodiesterase [Gallionellales bacterium RIFCSPLOWO2_12_FULL_59_22]
MLIRIPVKQLRLGMFIHELCGSWMDHPFWRGAFLLDDPGDLKTLLSTGLKEVWIDDSKGLGVEGGADREEVAAEIDKTLAQADKAITKARHVDIAQEAARAIKVCAKSKQAVTTMFHEARMGKALSSSDALPIVEEISTSVMRNPGALIGLARLKDKDDYTYMHSVAVCALMVSLARTLGLNDEQARQAGLAGLLHDVGKMMVPLSILNKPGKLTDAEFDKMKSHPAEGHKMLLEGIGIGEVALDVCLHHHEKVDGSGYPERLADQQISLYAKMGAVCDVYDAITSNRPYKNGWEPAESLRKMAEWSKGHFDTTIFHAFVKSVGIYPIGSLVRLESGHLGVIVDQTEKSLLTPILMVFFSIQSNCRITPELLDLSKPACKDKIVSHENPAKWDIHDIQELWSGVAVAPW